MKVKKRRISRKFLEGLLILGLILTLIISLRNIFIWQIDNNKINNSVDKIKKIVDVNEVIIPDEESIEESSYDIENQYWRYKDVPLVEVDINKLKNENSATVGWIKVNGTNINYPIVQANDNEYFLNHDFEGNWNIGGWIFADYRINLNDLSKNNIVYGHRRLNQSMFGTLKNVLTDEWLNDENNHLIKITTDKYNYLFQVVSVYTIKVESYYIQTDFNDEEYQTFINTVLDRSIHDFEIELNTSDKLLTLSTCDLLDADKRLVVHSKLVRKIEKN